VPDPETHEIHDLPSWSRLKDLLFKGGIETWKLKSVAKTIALRTDLQLLAADDQTTYSAVRQALDASQNKANVGTAVHRYTEYIDAGTLDRETVPAVAEPWVQAYERAKAEHGWSMVETEATVANLTVGYAGTADRFANIPGIGVVCFDVKTGKGVWPDIALQLAAYANAEFIWVPPTDTDLPGYYEALAKLEHDIAAGTNFTDYGSPRARKWSEQAKKVAHAQLDDLYWQEFAHYKGHRPMPEGLRTDIGYVAHLRDDKCELVPMVLDGTPSAFDVVRSLCVVFNWNQREAEIVGEPLKVASGTPEEVGPGLQPDPTPAVAGGPIGQEAPTTSGRTGPKANKVSDVQEKAQQRRANLPEPTADSLVDRIRALPALIAVELATFWPEAIPTFKQSRDQVPEQLQAIDTVLSRIEAEHELPFS
jgi:hypothetical protein